MKYFLHNENMKYCVMSCLIGHISQYLRDSSRISQMHTFCMLILTWNDCLILIMLYTFFFVQKSSQKNLLRLGCWILVTMETWMWSYTSNSNNDHSSISIDHTEYKMADIYESLRPTNINISKNIGRDRHHSKESVFANFERSITRFLYLTEKCKLLILSGNKLRNHKQCFGYNNTVT